MSPNEAKSPADELEPIGELTENLIPRSDDGYITEDVVPEVDEVLRSPTIPEPTHTDKTRRTLALGILGALILVYIGVFMCFLLTNMPMEKFTAAIAGVSGLQALAAAAVGFYYGRGQHNHD
jgi:hypothetical protein